MTPSTPRRIAGLSRSQLPRFVLLALAGMLAPTLVHAKEPPPPAYVPPPAEQVTNYFAALMPCKTFESGTHSTKEVKCRDRLLESKSLRELAILRNTIYARYGWDGFRKPWLRDHFRAQPWFKPNPKFSYRLISDVDKKNAHLIATMEQSLTIEDLQRMEAAVYARYPRSRGGASKALLSADDKIELGLLSRAMGDFGQDSADPDQVNRSLDRLLKLEELREFSLRDLRLLRNTIYAKHGRRFKSPLLQQHFDGMKWYTQRDDYSDKLLSRNDSRNVALIHSVEVEFGGALTDDDWLAEPATDGA